VQAKTWVLKWHFEGFPKDGDFELKVVELPELRNGEVLLEAVFLSVDPYMRPFSRVRMQDGDVMIGTQVAKVIQSNNPAFPVGCHVVGRCGWRTHTVSDGSDITRVLADWPQDVSLSHALGAIGMPGDTSAKKQNFPIFKFEFWFQVGGHFSSVAIQQMKTFGRIAVCGGISLYNDTTPQTGPYPHLTMIFKQLKMEGFLVGRWEHKNEESLKRMLTWMQEGKLKCREHVTVGFENMPAAFMGMLRGENIGKAIIKV
ncbi:putative prostaglandin reductase 1-like, partial [Triplophysa rosa]